MAWKLHWLLVTIIVIPEVLSQKMSAAVLQDLMTPLREFGEGCGYQGCPDVKEGVLNVHIVPHSHGELGFSKTFDEHYTGYKIVGKFKDAGTKVNWKRILDFVITELWNNRERKFTLSDTPYLFQWWSNRDGTVHRMVYELLRQGRLHIVGGGWGMPDETCTSYHAIIDQFTHSFRKLNRSFGPCGRPLVAWQADNFGHSREFTNLASMLGFDGLFINPISFEDELDRMKKKELEMIWRGSDDIGSESDVFTHKLFDGYWSPPGFCFGTMCSDPLIVTSDSVFKNVAERVSAFLSNAKDRQGFHYATNHIMVVMGKRMGYYDATMWFNNIDSLIKLVNQKSAESGEKVYAMYSAPACYLKAVHDSSPTLPIKQDDFLPITFDKTTHLTGLYTSRPTVKYMAREGHVYLQMAKQIHVLAGLSSKDARLYDDLSWVTGAFQDHNIITGAMRPRVKNYYTQKMCKAMEKSRLLMKKAFNKLRKSPAKTPYYRCSFNMSSCKQTNALRSFVVIYNPLAWPVTVPIRLPVVRHNRHVVYNPKFQTVKAVSMKISGAVRNIPRRGTSADHELIFIAEDLPPMGFRSYYIESNAAKKKKEKDFRRKIKAVNTYMYKKKRSIIKNLRNSKKKKYISRQTDQMKIDDESMLDAADEQYDGGTEDPETVETSSPRNITNGHSKPQDDAEYTVDNTTEEGKHRNKERAFFPNEKDEDYTWTLNETPTRISDENENSYTNNYESLKPNNEEIENDTTADESFIPNSEKQKNQNRSEKSFKLITEQENDPTQNESSEVMKEEKYNPFEQITESPDYNTTPKQTKEDKHTKLYIKPISTRTENTKAYINTHQQIPLLKNRIKDYKGQLANKSSAESTLNPQITKQNIQTRKPTEKPIQPKRTPKPIYPTTAVPKRTTTPTQTTITPRRTTTLIQTTITPKRTTTPLLSTTKIENVNTPPSSKSSLTGLNTTNQDPRKYPELPYNSQGHSVKEDDEEEERERLKMVREMQEMIRRRTWYMGAKLDGVKPLAAVTTGHPTRSEQHGTTTEYSPLDDPDFNEDANYFYRVSKAKFIKNRYVKVHLDAKKQVSRVTLSNGVEVALTISLLYYASDDPARMQRPEEKKPGAYIFRPMDPEPVLVKDYVRSVVHKTYLVEEVQYSMSSWAGLVVRVYAERPVIEVYWVVGPVPVDNDIGKDVFIRYTTDLASEGVFYTDSNGRQTMKRVRNSRPTYVPLLSNIPSNIYPVTSKIHVEDSQKNIRFSVLNDRAQGGTSLHDGQIDLMLHRRILTDDDGIMAILNDTEHGKGIVIRGKHTIYISKANHKPNKIYEKKLAKELEMPPQVFSSRLNAYGPRYKHTWYGHNNEFKGVVKKLPVGVHVLTLQEWNDGQLLIRLENYLEKSDTNKFRDKTVFLKDLFAKININSIKETTLGANVWLEDRVPMQWNARDKFLKNFNEFYNGDGTVQYSADDARDHDPATVDRGIVLTPQQIRTFIVTYNFHK